MKPLKDTLQRSLTQNSSRQYVAKVRKEIGTSINEVAFATGHRASVTSK